jgi:hypothetical protein
MRVIFRGSSLLCAVCVERRDRSHECRKGWAIHLTPCVILSTSYTVCNSHRKEPKRVERESHGSSKGQKATPASIAEYIESI